MKRAVFIIAASAALAITGQASAADGKTVYDKTCAGCHAAMAPKMGDKAAFAPLIKQGVDTVAAVVIKGKGAMPPKGGAASDTDVKAAVEYMFSKSK